MDESTVVGWGDPPAEELPEYDPEFEALMQTVLAGCDNPAEVDVEAALARGFAGGFALDDEIADQVAGFGPETVDRPVADLDDEGLINALQSAHRSIAMAQARQAVVITELAHRRAKDAVTELTGRKARGQEALSIGARALDEEISLELCLSKATTGTLVNTSVGLCTETPDTLDALSRGEIDWVKAAAIVDLVQTLVLAQANTNPDLEPDEQIDPEQLGKALEKDLLQHAAQEPVANLRRRAAQTMIEVNTRAAEYRHRIKRSQREFWYSADEDSMCRIGGYLPADAGMRVKHALTRLAYHARADAGPGDKRTLDQLRIDSLVDVLTAAADNIHRGDAAGRAEAGPGGVGGEGEGQSDVEGHIPDDETTFDDDLVGGDVNPSEDDRSSSPVPSGDDQTSSPGKRLNRHGNRRRIRVADGPGRGRSGSDPRVTVTISASTLIGLDHAPGYLHGFGPVVASMARDVAATGSWRCAITDDGHGTLLGLGTSTYTPRYRPTQALRRFLATRDRVCRVPGCNAPAQVCDVDHRIPWPAGATCECTTECLCGTHHRLKHEAGFTLTPSTDPDDPPGTLYWGTPAGHQFPSYPAQLDANPSKARAPGR